MPHSSNVFVFVATEGRLEADILVARLNESGTPPDLVSALYRPASRPNCAGGLLRGAVGRLVSSGDAILISGPLRFLLGDSRHSPGPLASGLRILGLGSAQSSSLEEALLADRIVLCVQAESDRGFAAIVRTLRENFVKPVFVSRTFTDRTVPASRWDRTEPTFRAVCACPA
jgi:hypothetical protein